MGRSDFKVRCAALVTVSGRLEVVLYENSWPVDGAVASLSRLIIAS